MEIKINNNIYKINFVESDNENLKIDDGEYHSGVTNFITKEIYIANNLKGNSLRYTLIHELTHAMIDSYGFMQIYWNDEIVADFMANYLNNIIDLSNKIIINYDGEKNEF